MVKKVCVALTKVPDSGVVSKDDKLAARDAIWRPTGLYSSVSVTHLTFENPCMKAMERSWSFWVG